MPPVQAVKTGIAELDHLFAVGGYPRGNQILLMGGPGTGKSIFALQFLYRGAVDHGEAGIYVCLDEPPEKLRRNAIIFNWDLKAAEDQKKLVMIDAISARVGVKARTEQYLDATFDLNTVLAKLEKMIWELDARRLVIDSLSVMNLYSQNKSVERTNLLKMANSLGDHVTSLIIAEARTEDIGLRKFPPETFLFDGVVSLRLDPDTQERKLAIRKMRGTKHVLGSFKFQIGSDGIALMP